MNFRQRASFLQKAKFHFVGIGGIGMCGLAELLFRLGAQVTGSDLTVNANTEHLKSLGLEIAQGHRPENVNSADVVVYSSAIKGTNPEIIYAKKEKIPLIPRAEALAEIMRFHRRGIAVAGTHGKTTTTSMVSAIFLHAQVEPTIVVGGRLDLISSTAQLGNGDWIIAEADESDGSFQKLNPELAIITNIDTDHLDFFQNFENLKIAFRQFAEHVPFYGALIACGDDLILREVLSPLTKTVLYYGFSKDCDYLIEGGPGQYSLRFQDQILGQFEPKVPGRHNALNATAAIVAGLQAGFDFKTCKEGLAHFAGVDRRFHFLGDLNGILLYDDYGHHPTEICATLQGVRERFPKSKIRAFFQPHRYSRTQLCWDDFLTCFQQADEVWITDVYPAGEAPISDITGQRLADQIRHPHVRYIEKSKWIDFLSLKSGSLAQTFTQGLERGDLLLTLGAGDLYKLGPGLLSSRKKV